MLEGIPSSADYGVWGERRELRVLAASIFSIIDDHRMLLIEKIVILLAQCKQKLSSSHESDASWCKHIKVAPPGGHD